MEFLFTEKISQDLLSKDPEEFEGIKIVTWYAMLNKGLKPLNWFVMGSCTKISYKRLNDKAKIDEELQKLNAYIQKQHKKYSNRGARNEVAAM
jgi:hypothetical protein